MLKKAKIICFPDHFLTYSKILIFWLLINTYPGTHSTGMVTWDILKKGYWLYWAIKAKFTVIITYIYIWWSIYELYIYSDKLYMSFICISIYFYFIFYMYFCPLINKESMYDNWALFPKCYIPSIRLMSVMQKVSN